MPEPTSKRISKIINLLSLKSEEAYQYLKYLRPHSPLPKQRFVIVCDYRSGSTLLANLLNQNPDIYCDDEIFIPFIKHRLARLAWPYGYLQGKLTNIAKPVYGFDCKVSQIMAMGIRPENTAALFFKKLHQENWKFIYLKRLNLVRKSLSNYIAISRQHWHDRPSESLQRRKVTVNIERFAKMLKRHEEIDWSTERLMVDIPHLPIIYEHDLLISERHKPTVHSVCDYLKTTTFYRETNMRRVSTDRLSDDINNFDEVISFLRSSPYASYVDFKC